MEGDQFQVWYSVMTHLVDEEEWDDHGKLSFMHKGEESNTLRTSVNVQYHSRTLSKLSLAVNSRHKK